MTTVRNLLVLACTAVLAFSQEILTNEDVIKLTKAGLGDEVVLGTIQSRVAKFSLGTDDLIALKKAGVSDKVIAAMVARNQNQPANQNTPATPVAAPSQAVPATIETLLLHDGTPIRLRLSRNLSSADAKTGETVDFEVLEDVKVDDVLVVARGATAMGTITDAEHKKRMARGGKLDVNIDYVRLVNDEKVALRAVKETRGGGHTGAMTGGMVATAIVFFPAAPFFLFMQGKDTTIPKGTEITAYTDGEVSLDRPKFLAKMTAARTIAPPPVTVAAPSENNSPLRLTVQTDTSLSGTLYYQVDDGSLSAWQLSAGVPLSLSAQSKIVLFAENDNVSKHLRLAVNEQPARLQWVNNGKDLTCSRKTLPAII